MQRVNDKLFLDYNEISSISFVNENSWKVVMKNGEIFYLEDKEKKELLKSDDL